MPESQVAQAAYKLCPTCRQIYPASANFCVRDRSELFPDDRIIQGKYILLGQIGAGTMSEVYDAEQPQLGRRVAIKMLRRSPEVMRRFFSELRAVGRISHPHVCTIHDSGFTEDGRPYIAMEYLEGKDLSQVLRKSGPIESPRALILWMQAVSAIAAAHKQGVVHRDIKPANLFVTTRDTDDGEEEIIKVIDFSIAKLDKPQPDMRPTEPGALVGTMLYMAPEQLERGEASPRSDVYSLGLVLVEMLTGRLPWGRGHAQPDVNLALLRLVRSPEPLEKLASKQKFSPELLQLAEGTLSLQAEQRPTDATELLRRIKKLPEMREFVGRPLRLPVTAKAPTNDKRETSERTPLETLGDPFPHELLDKFPEDSSRPSTKSDLTDVVLGQKLYGLNDDASRDTTRILPASRINELLLVGDSDVEEVAELSSSFAVEAQDSGVFEIDAEPAPRRDWLPDRGDDSPVVEIVESSPEPTPEPSTASAPRTPMVGETTQPVTVSGLQSVGARSRRPYWLALGGAAVLGAAAFAFYFFSGNRLLQRPNPHGGTQLERPTAALRDAGVAPPAAKENGDLGGARAGVASAVSAASTPDLSAAGAPVADPNADAAAVEPSPAPLLTSSGGAAFAVRFTYKQKDRVTFDCTGLVREGKEKGSARRSFTVEISPGGFCEARGRKGSNRYEYDWLAKQPKKANRARQIPVKLRRTK